MTLKPRQNLGHMPPAPGSHNKAAMSPGTEVQNQSTARVKETVFFVGGRGVRVADIERMVSTSQLGVK